MRTVIFDLDGTLADTSVDLINAANACFRKLGVGDVLDPLRDQGTAFRGGRAMLDLGRARLHLSDTIVEELYPYFLETYAGALDQNTFLYEGAIDAVKTLRRDGYAIGICTNKPVEMAEDVLQKLGVRDLFGSLIGVGSLPVRKPDPAPYIEAVAQLGGTVERSVLIGDTVTDRDTARAAGVPVILVTFGPNGDEVRRLDPDALLPHFTALPKMVADLIG